jgi:hypothetical protein
VLVLRLAPIQQELGLIILPLPLLQLLLLPKILPEFLNILSHHKFPSILRNLILLPVLPFKLIIDLDHCLCSLEFVQLEFAFDLVDVLLGVVLVVGFGGVVGQVFVTDYAVPTFFVFGPFEGLGAGDTELGPGLQIINLL